MATFLKAITDTLDAVLHEQPERLPVRPAIIQALASIPDDLKNLSVVTDDWSALERWIAKLRNLMETDSRPLAESLLFRALEYHVPRIAGTFIVLGLIEHGFAGDALQNHRIVWPRLFTFLTQPEALFEYWKSKIQHPEDVQLLQIYVPMLIYAPLGFLDMEHQRQGFSALPATLPLRPELHDLLDETARSPTPLPQPPSGLIHLPAFVQLVQQAALPPFASIEVTGPIGPDLLQKIDLDAKLTIPNPAGKLIGPRFDAGNGWTVGVSSAAPAGQTLELHRQNGQWTSSGGTLQGEMIALDVNKEGSPALSLGDSRFLLMEIARLKLLITLRAPESPGASTRLYSVGFEADGLSVAVKAPGLDLLGGGDGLRAQTDVRADYVQGEGLRGQGNPAGPPAALGLDFVTPINRSIGGGAAGLTVGSMRLCVQVNSDPPNAGDAAIGLLVMVRLTFDVKGRFGPLDVVAEGLGGWFGRWRESAGPPPQYQYADFIPPTGIGVSMTAGPISGGGFLSVQPLKGGVRYGGALALKLQMIGIGALGILEQTTAGKSFVAVLGIRFNPGIQLSFGFELTGVGGLVGIDRRADVDVLRERLASGAAGNVLFCDDPVRNGPALLGDLGAFFPAAPGSFLVGPTLQLGWISPIIRLDLGILIEMPGPRKILIVGSARAIIGTEDVALVRLRLDFVGGIDLVQQQITFDASLVNSSVLGFLTLTGDAAFRLCYGDRPDIVLSIGGFHPSFNAESLHLRALARAAATYSIGAGVRIWLRQEAYFAFTSNTLQVGGRTEAGMEIGPFGAHGFLGLDALVQFHPFFFTVGFSAGFDLNFEGASFAGVSVSGQISGPGPIVISASASIKLLFVRVSHSETFTLGSDHPDDAPKLTSVLPVLLVEASNPANLQAAGDDAMVRVKADPPTDQKALLSPVGRLTWTQKVSPLETTITRLGGQPLNGPQRVDVKVANAPAGLKDDPASEWFSPGQFMDLNESQQLNNPAMQLLAAGRGFSGDLELSPGPVPTNPDNVNIIRLPKEIRLAFLGPGANALLLSGAHVGTMQDRLLTPVVSGGDGRVTIREEKWTVNDGSGQPSAQTYSAIEAFQQARYAVSGGFAVRKGDTPINVSAV